MIGTWLPAMSLFVSSLLCFLCLLLADLFRSCILIVLTKSGLKHVPQWSGNTYRRISTANNTTHQGKCKFLNGRHTHDIYKEYHYKCCKGCIYCSCQRLGNRSIYNCCITFFAHADHVLTNTVKDNDRCIDRITDNRQQ